MTIVSIACRNGCRNGAPIVEGRCAPRNLAAGVAD
jgi:hypothetical protein